LTGDASFKRRRGGSSTTRWRASNRRWFPEVGGMDLGYCSVLLDYVMNLHVGGGGPDRPSSHGAAVKFMLPLMHPDATISPEMGLCLNPYVSRLGIGLLSQSLEESA
jgi:hypothetical protein